MSAPILKKRILFVDDESSVLNGLKRSLRTQRHSWDMQFASGGAAALQILDSEPFDAIVTDMRMPGMDGAMLLESVINKHPHLIRIILSGHSDEDLILRTVETAHQFLSKPCDVSKLKDVLIRAFELREYIGSSQLHSFLTGLKHLPSIPVIYLQLMQKMNSEQATLRAVGEIISQDPAMTTKILQLVNSAFYGIGHNVSKCEDAATLIGLNSLKSLVLSVGIFSQYEQNGHDENYFSMEALLEHNLAVARLSERIARAEKMEQKLVEESFLAGMLHELGILILQQNFPQQYSQIIFKVTQQNGDLCALEKEQFATSHEAVGAYLLGLWGLPQNVVEAVASMHNPDLLGSTAFHPGIAVYVADLLLGQLKGEQVLPELAADDVGFLKKAGLLNRLEIWKQLLNEETGK